MDRAFSPNQKSESRNNWRWFKPAYVCIADSKWVVPPSLSALTRLAIFSLSSSATVSGEATSQTTEGGIKAGMTPVYCPSKDGEPI